MTLAIQISDPHFGTERPAVVAALVRLVHALKPELAILSGDITQRARVREFKAARAFIDQLQVPRWIAIPGNHDIPLVDLWTRLMRPYARYQRHLQSPLEGEYTSENLLVLMVNTTRWYRHVNGEVSTSQIARVAERLSQATASQLRMVVTHQPVVVPTTHEQHNLLRRHAQAIRAWARAGADLLMGGHIHLPYVCPLHERHAGLERQLWAVQAGTAVSSRIRHEAGNSVNVILTNGGAAYRVERWDYDETNDAFDCVNSTALLRQAGPYG